MSDLKQPRPPRPCCGRNFKSPRAAFLHWLHDHSQTKLGEGERSVMRDLARLRDPEVGEKDDE